MRLATPEEAREGRLVKSWQTKGGRYYYDLYYNKWGYHYKGGDYKGQAKHRGTSGGGIEAASDEEAIQKMEKMHIIPAKVIDKINYIEVD
jgi:hypothetical protein